MREKECLCQRWLVVIYILNLNPTVALELESHSPSIFCNTFLTTFIRKNVALEAHTVQVKITIFV